MQKGQGSYGYISKRLFYITYTLSAFIFSMYYSKIFVVYHVTAVKYKKVCMYDSDFHENVF